MRKSTEWNVARPYKETKYWKEAATWTERTLESLYYITPSMWNGHNTQLHRDGRSSGPLGGEPGKRPLGGRGVSVGVTTLRARERSWRHNCSADAAIHGVAESRTRLSNSTELNWIELNCISFSSKHLLINNSLEEMKRKQMSLFLN